MVARAVEASDVTTLGDAGQRLMRPRPMSPQPAAGDAFTAGWARNRVCPQAMTMGITRWSVRV